MRARMFLQKLALIGFTVAVIRLVFIGLSPFEIASAVLFAVSAIAATPGKVRR